VFDFKGNFESGKFTATEFAKLVDEKAKEIFALFKEFKKQYVPSVSYMISCFVVTI
jgi:hypothetical protein